MRNRIILTLFFSALVLCGCNSTKNASQSTTTTDTKDYTSLADYLRRNSNVSVQGVHPDIRLQIRGVGSMTADTRPFIYVDKTPMGRDYSRANNYVNPNNIKRIVILSSLADLTTYGQEGHSGVIRIYTRSGVN